jgi:hypothetical protein
MAFIQLCDLCGKEVNRDGLVRIESYSRWIERREYCLECWSNKDNWEDMHYISTLKDEK